MPNRRLILASSSPRRKELLSCLGAEYSVVPSAVDEDSLIASLGDVTPERLVQDLATAKALDVYSSNTDSVVVGADTVVVLDGKVLGKPVDAAHAHEMLSSLVGKTHEVYTGIAVVGPTGTQCSAVRTFVTFRHMNDVEISNYVATGEPMDKAGSYGIQNREISPVASIAGDYYNVMGLPLQELRSLLVNYVPGLHDTPPQPVL
jgi:septum formation protein